MLNYPNARNPLTNIEYNRARQRNRNDKQELEIQGTECTYLRRLIILAQKKKREMR